MPGRATLRAVAALGVAALGAGLYWSLGFAHAGFLFGRDARESVQRAARLVPGNSRYQARLAVLLEAEGDRAGAAAALENAVAVNHLDAASWVALGLRKEMNRDFAGAERCLLQAAGVDRTYDPRWALANFYFRRGDRDRFWLWAKRAAEMACGDMRPLFRLCWNATEDPAAILSRVIPQRPEVLRQYLVFLLQEGSLESAASLAAILAAHSEPEDLPALLDACDRLLDSGNAGGALPVWNALSARKLISAVPLSPRQGRSLTNGAFASAPGSRGFDWRLPAIEGVSISRAEAKPFLRVSFSGRQPERCEVLWQYVPLIPGSRYRFEFEYRTSGVGAGTGLRWRVSSPFGGGGKPLADSAGLSSEEWSRGAVPFDMPPELRLARLALFYQRAPGTTRIEGAVSLRNLGLGFAP